MTMRFALTSRPETVKILFGHHNMTDFPPREEIAPTEPVLIIRLDHGGRREIDLVRWGLIPSWVKDPLQYSPLFNARAETVRDKPSFRGPLRHRRCLVPADAFYEWTGLEGARRRYIVRAEDRRPFGLAGIWDHWLGADGSEIETMAILTQPAGPELAHAVERQPVVVHPADYEVWLNTSSGRITGIERLLRTAAAGGLIIESEPCR